MIEFFLGIYAFTAGVFIFGSFMFWAAFLILSGLIFWCDDRESQVWGTFTVLGTVFLFNASGILPISGFVSFLAGVALYLVCGVLWSIAKWYFYLPRKKEELLKLKTQFITAHNARISRNTEDAGFVSTTNKRRIQSHGPFDGAPYMELLSEDVADQLPKEVREDFRQYLREEGYFSRSYDSSTKIIPRASDNKWRITGWVTYWPWSAAWTLINEPVRKAVKFIWRHMSSTYQRIADRSFAGVADDEV